MEIMFIYRSLREMDDMIDKLLKAISFIALMGFFISISFIDSDGQAGVIAIVIAAGCLVWLLIYYFIGGFNGC